MQVLLTECYEIITPESAADGDAAERGLITEREPVSVRDAIEKLRECSALSTSPIRSVGDCRFVWAETDGDTNYRTGAVERRSIHLRAWNGGELSARQMARMLRAGGLVDLSL